MAYLDVSGAHSGCTIPSIPWISCLQATLLHNFTSPCRTNPNITEQIHNCSWHVLDTIQKIQIHSRHGSSSIWPEHHPLVPTGTLLPCFTALQAWGVESKSGKKLHHLHGTTRTRTVLKVNVPNWSQLSSVLKGPKWKMDKHGALLPKRSLLMPVPCGLGWYR